MKKKVLKESDFNDLIEYRNLIDTCPCIKCAAQIGMMCSREQCFHKDEKREYLDKLNTYKYRRIRHIYMSDKDVRDLIDLYVERQKIFKIHRDLDHRISEALNKICIDCTEGINEVLEIPEGFYIGDDYKEESK